MTKAESRSLESRLHGSTARLLAVSGVALFGSAGTLRYWQGWTYMAMQLVSLTATNLYLLRHDRELARRRLAVVEAGEAERLHRVFFALVRIMVLGMLVVCGLDRRFAWSAVPLPVVLGGCFGFAAGTLLIFLVFRANTHASSVIVVETAQTVVATGPYRAVRHPMYSGALLGALATPLALGSYVGEAFFLPMVVLFVVRLLAEERFLAGALRGYGEYMGRTRKRLVPGVW